MSIRSTESCLRRSMLVSGTSFGEMTTVSLHPTSNPSDAMKSPLVLMTP
jgi:hypothetical protein